VRGQRGDRFEQPLAVAERDAEPLQVGFGQIDEDVGVNIALAERCLVPRQSQVLEPRRDVHGDPPRAAIGSKLSDR
jgi:hypothetical protein